MKLSEPDQKKPRRRRLSSVVESDQHSDSPDVGEACERSGFLPDAGQWVEVRALEEIMASLDERGTFEGLPFMPEMIGHCGNRYRVKRFANKACVNGESNYIGRLESCVVLQTPLRCDGSAHAGCEMGCQFFWKTEWLTPVESKDSSPQSGVNHANQWEDDSENQAAAQWLVERTRVGPKSDSDPRQYRCQATELVQIALPIGPFKVQQYVVDNRRDKISIASIGSFLFSLFWKKLSRKTDNLVGPNARRTPTQTIGLKLGERVRVKSLKNIRNTLDVDGRNRGLWFDPKEMGQFCGQELVVSRKITKMVDEKTGNLIIIKQPTVVLSETECSGVFRRFCSRGSLHFWREIWLERV